MSSSKASLSYVTVGTNDPAKARLFYAQLMAAIGATQIADCPAVASSGSCGRTIARLQPLATA
jgi:hypothetical protein